jgi:hypothetical protein
MIAAIKTITSHFQSSILHPPFFDREKLLFCQKMEDGEWMIENVTPDQLDKFNAEHCWFVKVLWNFVRHSDAL